jgi:enoyl-CoA hydratase/carnithine racemase
MADLEYGVEDCVATIQLNRPERKNSFTLEMVEEWASRLREAETDDSVRVVVVTGSGDSFCSGVDLDVLTGRERTPLSERNLLTKHVHQVAYAAEALSKPYIAAVNGVAVGAGMDMSLMADLRIAASSARFSEGYVRIGVVPGDGGCYYLPRVVGAATALRLLWTGEWVDAEAARRLGIVTEVCPDEELERRTVEFARQIAAQPPIAVQLIKRAVQAGEQQDLRNALELIAAYQAVATSTDDSREALAAFREHRVATYEGR